MMMLQHRMLPICVTEHFPHKHADDDEHMGASTITLILTLDFARTRPGPGTDQGRIRNRTCLPCLCSMPRVAVQRTFLPQQDADDDDHTTTMQRLMTTEACPIVRVFQIRYSYWIVRNPPPIQNWPRPGLGQVTAMSPD